MKVLAIIGDRPNPPVTGTRVRNHHLWPAVGRLSGVDLRLLGLDLASESEEPAAVPGVSAEFLPPGRQPRPVRMAFGAMRSFHQNQRSQALVRRVDEVVAEWRPDVIHAEELRMAYYLPGVRGQRSGAKESVTFHNVESDLYSAIGSSPVPLAREFFKAIQVQALRHFERRAATIADIAFAYSERDRQRYSAMIPAARWTTTRNGADVRGIAPTPVPSVPKLLLVGNLSYHPNVMGLLWFLDEVAPRLPPGVSITVAGSGAGEPLRARLAREGIRFEDSPRDLRPLYEEHAVALVPVLDGSGTRGKILEALAYQRLVVTTPKGPEGLELAEGEGIVIAEGAKDFASAVERVLGSAEERAEIARKGRQAVLERYDWTIVAAEMNEAWSR